MHRYRFLRPFALIVLVIIAVLSILYAIFGNRDVGVLSLIAGALAIPLAIPTLADWLPDREAKKARKSENPSVEEYFEARGKEFNKEEDLFVKLAGNTVVETRYSTDEHEFEDIAKALAL